MKHKLIRVDSINSTSVWARRHLGELNNFDIISAELQTAGHGQFERKWFSSDKNGGNIYISIVLKPENTTRLGELTRFSSQQAAKTIEEFGVKGSFKYPNDILVNGKKIAGILAESVFIGNIFKGVVVGIGINLNLTAEELGNIDIAATSIFNETGKNINKEEFLLCLLDNYKKHYEDFLENGLVEDISYADK